MKELTLKQKISTINKLRNYLKKSEKEVGDEAYICIAARNLGIIQSASPCEFAEIFPELYKIICKNLITEDDFLNDSLGDETDYSIRYKILDKVEKRLNIK